MSNLYAGTDLPAASQHVAQGPGELTHILIRPFFYSRWKLASLPQPNLQGRFSNPDSKTKPGRHTEQYFLTTTILPMFDKLESDMAIVKGSNS
ncbi:hypothetical protein Pcinc_032485 [Petrolisthes cinctipes]|uniref:Uncharacterized protein n=1 Tax=Petrolisthes cinctipes TaxID=88211 RepID=A0AAE1EUP5_PETCI|nr:hypothetical protein Pcinc_032485 [Petrolisthes cinctipes]